MTADNLTWYVNHILSNHFQSWDHAPDECGAPYFVIDGKECRIVREGYDHMGDATITCNRIEDGRTVCFVNRNMYVLPGDEKPMAKDIAYWEDLVRTAFDRECDYQARAELLAYLNDGEF